MTSSSTHSAATRRQVRHGGRLIESLWQRQLKDGTTVFEASLRIGGKKKRKVLTARTLTEAIRQLDGLRVDRNRAVAHENPLINPTVAELFDEYLAHVQSRVGIRDERHRYTQSTANLYKREALLYITRQPPFHRGVRVRLVPLCTRLVFVLRLGGGLVEWPCVLAEVVHCFSSRDVGVLGRREEALRAQAEAPGQAGLGRSRPLGRLSQTARRASST